MGRYPQILIDFLMSCIILRVLGTFENQRILSDEIHPKKRKLMIPPIQTLHRNRVEIRFHGDRFSDVVYDPTSS